MRSALVLGSGRSGTSLLAGTLSQSGYYMGDAPVEAGDANPKGFFEDYKINWINETMLRPVTSRRFEYGWRWLAPVPLGVHESEIALGDEVLDELKKQTARQPFCFKDPRFCYTLPFWRPYVQDACFLCVFREPGRTARSMVKECQTASYLRGCELDFASAIDVWTLMYRHILEIHRRHGDWLFVHYDQLLDGSAIPAIADFVGAPTTAFGDAALARSPRANDGVPAEALAVYEQLCCLARYPA